MNQFQIEKLLRDSIHELFIKDSIFMSEEYDIHERTVAHRLAIYIEKRFPEYHVDVEYARSRESYGTDDIGNIIGKRLPLENIKDENNYRYVYPDIIIHKRDKQENLVEIELKFGWKNKEKEYDLLKINEYIEQLGYQFGVYIELAEKEKDCKIEFGPFLKKTSNL